MLLDFETPGKTAGWGGVWPRIRPRAIGTLYLPKFCRMGTQSPNRKKLTILCVSKYV